MFCYHCGGKLEDGAKFCPMCGSAVRKVRKSNPLLNGLGKVGRSIKKFILVPRNAILTFVGVLLLALITFTTVQAISYSKLVESKQYDSANEMYSSIASDKKLILSKLLMDFVVSRKVEDTYSRYVDGKISYEDANKVLSFPSELYPVKEKADEYIAAVRNLYNSREAMKSAVAKEIEKDYFQAIDYYKKVIPEDKKNYEDSKGAISRCTTQLYSHYTQKAISLFAEKKYYEAIMMLEEVLKYYPNDSKIISKIAEYSRDCKNKVIAECDSLMSLNNYEAALKVIVYARVFFDNDAELVNKENECEAAKKEYERIQLELERQREYERQNPLSITSKSATYDSYSRSFLVEFTLQNTSSFYISSARVEATILDANNNYVSSGYTYIWDMSSGQTGSSSFYVYAGEFYPYFRLEISDIELY